MPGYTSVNWIVCGSTQQSEGCYSFGSLGPFGKVGALVEGNPVVDFTTDTVTRNIYVVDQAVGGGTGVMLYVYTKVDSVVPAGDRITVTLTNTVPLTLIGGTNAATYMVANKDFLYIATNQSASVAQIQKSTLTVNENGGAGPAVSSITSDGYGFVTINFGTVSSQNVFVTYGPNGYGTENGGGTQYLLGTSTALSTANLATASSSAATPSLAARIQVRMKATAPQVVSGNTDIH
ncbi:hypothetical protein [Dyella lipolytica]|uniref:Uncharacterized protein n=1 Tax=Dyella lipolytica TaxID=1867835 RepID=A0ABW8IZ21_9GAMM|nr:hypothetical protein [Dyella lipolytica]